MRFALGRLTSSTALIAALVVAATATAPPAAAADSTAPVVTLTAPANGAHVRGTSVALTATATDDVAVTGVQFLFDGTTNVGTSDSSAPYSRTWNTTAVADGTHTLSAVARDAAGNSCHQHDHRCRRQPGARGHSRDQRRGVGDEHPHGDTVVVRHRRSWTGIADAVLQFRNVVHWHPCLCRDNDVDAVVGCGYQDGSRAVPGPGGQLVDFTLLRLDRPRHHGPDRSPAAPRPESPTMRRRSPGPPTSRRLPRSSTGSRPATARHRRSTRPW